jgi:outer membrane protein OmpA-like peptidoglycan-associated protein/opacity protein-like surface antigen
MKSIFTLTKLLLIMLVFSGNLAFAQMQDKWEAGVFLGVANYQGDLVETTLFTPQETNFGFGVSLKKHFNPNWSVGLGFKHGKLSGDDQNFSENASRARRNFSFSSPVNELALRLEWDPLGHKRYNEDGTFNRKLTPYLFVGAGMTFFNPETTYGNGVYPDQAFEQRVNTDKSNGGASTGFVTPVGAGLRYDLNQKWNLGLEFGYRPPFTDLLDGVAESGDPDNNDWYVFGGLTIGYKFSFGKDTDGDGVTDAKDRCPDVPGLASLDGCPDRDGDGVADKKDDCPDLAGPADLKGCPDTDGDGIVDPKDDCPQVAGGIKMNGCPDADGDGVVDMEDACPNQAGIRSLNGCPDSDGDGITDAEDKCPNEAGVKMNEGCPDYDTDGDGVVDRMDKCPQIPGLGKFEGCPDTDGDGVQDSKDKCPNTVGSVLNGGCPDIKAEDQKILDLAVKNVQFETSLSVLKTASKPVLDQVADILNRYPDYNIKISGYTDNRGNAAANQTLSENRAATCANYLISKGIDRKRIEYHGYGQTNPVASNDTAEGRSQNRRVEFELISK